MKNALRILTAALLLLLLIAAIGPNRAIAASGARIALKGGGGERVSTVCIQQLPVKSGISPVTLCGDKAVTTHGLRRVRRLTA